MQRRDFIKGAAAAPFCFRHDAWAAVSDEGRRRVIVVLLRGAVDGLNVVIPCADEAYYRERQSIAIAPPGSSAISTQFPLGLLCRLLRQVTPSSRVPLMLS